MKTLAPNSMYAQASVRSKTYVCSPRGRYVFRVRVLPSSERVQVSRSFFVTIFSISVWRNTSVVDARLLVLLPHAGEVPVSLCMSARGQRITADLDALWSAVG